MTSAQSRPFSWMSPKLEVRETEKYGKGVFAKTDIKKDETLALFGGYILSLEEEAILPQEHKDSGVQIDDNFVLSSCGEAELGDYFNHSCDPNAGFSGQIRLVTIKNISAGEEICFDYAMAVAHSGDQFYVMDCHCGSNHCRSKITGEDWKIPELQLKYKGYFQQYIADKINNT